MNKNNIISKRNKSTFSTCFKTIALGFTLLFFISLATSQPTFNYNFVEGYEIIEAPQRVLYINEDYNYNFFLVNSTTGLKVDDENINCSFFIQYEGGELVYQNYFVSTDNGFYYFYINDEVFNKIGYYNYGVYCSNNFGGAKSGEWKIINRNTILTLNFENTNVLIFYIIFLILGCLMLYLKMYDISGLIFVIAGLILLFSTQYFIIASLIIVIGILIIFYSKDGGSA